MKVMKILRKYVLALIIRSRTLGSLIDGGGRLLIFNFFPTAWSLLGPPRTLIFKKICSDQDVFTPDFKKKQLFGTSVIHF